MNVDQKRYKIYSPTLIKANTNELFVLRGENDFAGLLVFKREGDEEGERGKSICLSLEPETDCESY